MGQKEAPNWPPKTVGCEVAVRSFVLRPGSSEGRRLWRVSWPRPGAFLLTGTVLVSLPPCWSSCHHPLGPFLLASSHYFYEAGLISQSRSCTKVICRGAKDYGCNSVKCLPLYSHPQVHQTLLYYTKTIILYLIMADN